MTTFNRNLGMLSLVLRVYGKELYASGIIACAQEPEMAALHLSPEQMATLLSRCGLACMSVYGEIDVVLPIAQEQADNGHLVLTGMHPSKATPYPHWGVLRETRPGGPAIILLSDHEDVLRADKRMGDLVTGHMIVMADVVKKGALERMYASMRE